MYLGPPKTYNYVRKSSNVDHFMGRTKSIIILYGVVALRWCLFRIERGFTELSEETGNRQKIAKRARKMWCRPWIAAGVWSSSEVSGSKKWRHTTRQLRGLRRLRFAWKQKSDAPGKVLRKRGMELCFDESATSTWMKTQIRVENKRPVRLEWRWLYFCSVSDFPFCRLSNARWIFASIEVDFVWDADVPYKDFFQVAKRWIV